LATHDGHENPSARKIEWVVFWVTAVMSSLLRLVDPPRSSRGDDYNLRTVTTTNHDPRQSTIGRPHRGDRRPRPLISLFVLERHWRSLGKTLDPEDFTDAQAIAAITRITRGNFRLLERLFPQIQRVLKINELDRDCRTVR